MPTITVDTENDSPVELYFESHGTGAPVVLIHGWPLDGRSWEKQVGALVDAGYRAITYDRRGFGRSTPTWGGHDFDTVAADLDALLTQLELTEATLVGFSAGGGAVARYLGTYGTGRVAKAVLASAVTPFLYATEGNPEGGLDDATIAHFEAGITADRADFIDHFLSMFYSTSSGLTVSEAQRAYGRDLANGASARATLAGVSAFGRTDFRADLEKFTVPTLVIHGDADQVVPFQISGRRAAAAIPGSELVVIEGGPHGINVSHADQFNAALLAFLVPLTSSSSPPHPPSNRRDGAMKGKTMSISTLSGKLITAGVAAAAVLALGFAAPAVADATTATHVTSPKPTIVLVHGAWADASSFAPVTAELQKDGYTVLNAPNPLRGIAPDAAAVAAFVQQATTGPVVLVGHSYGGTVITNAATQTPRVKALVYIDAYAPAKGETIIQLTGAKPGSLLAADPTTVFNFVQYPTDDLTSTYVAAYIKPELFQKIFAADLPTKQARVLAASQSPVATDALGTPSGDPAWQTIKSYFFVGTDDKVIPAAEQLAMANRANGVVVKAKADHLSMLEVPGKVTALIEKAALVK